MERFDLTGRSPEDDGLMRNLDRLHTTELGVERIRRNLRLDVGDVVEWCRRAIGRPDSRIARRGKNWYIETDGCEITVNAHSFTVITAHRRRTEGDR